MCARRWRRTSTARSPPSAQIGYTDVELLWSFNNFGKSTGRSESGARSAKVLRAPSAHIRRRSRCSWAGSAGSTTRKTLGHEYLIVPSLTADTSRRSTTGVSGRTTSTRRARWRDAHGDLARVPQRAGPHEADRRSGPVRCVRRSARIRRSCATSSTSGTWRSAAAIQCDIWSGIKRPLLELPLQGRGGGSVARHGARRRRRSTFGRIIAAIPNIAAKPCYVEQEGSADSLASAKRSFEFLRRTVMRAQWES